MAETVHIYIKDDDLLEWAKEQVEENRYRSPIGCFRERIEKRERKSNHA